MNHDVKILILKIIKFNGDITPLINLGYEYSQVVQLINNEITAGNAYMLNGALTLTENGNKLIEVINKSFSREGSSGWIEPEISSKVSKIEINEIFLPDQDDLSF